MTPRAEPLPDSLVELSKPPFRTGWAPEPADGVALEPPGTSEVLPIRALPLPSKERRSQSAIPSPDAPSAHHVQWVDWAKGIGISCVVFGHAWRGLHPGVRVHSPPLLVLLDSAIYGFHMPLFFFLSGLFVVKSARQPAREFVGKKLKSIVYPYFLWSFLQAGMASVLRDYTQSNKGIVFAQVMRASLYFPYSQFWFLYVMALCMGVFLALFKLRMRPQ